VRFLRAALKAFCDLGWALSPLAGPSVFEFAQPPAPQVQPGVDPLTVPLTACERETFQELTSVGW
jgi:hypothetical protein